MRMLKKILFVILRYSGLPYLFREVFQRNRVTILLFHDISRNEADTIFSSLEKKYNIISLNQFLEFLKNPNSNPNPLPKKSAIITFDDGHRSNYNILPEIKKYSVPLTIFLCTEIINTKRHFWFHQEHPSVSKNKLKQLPDDERQEILEEIGFVQYKENGSAVALNSDQIKEMIPYVNFQAHSQFHPILPRCSPEIAKKEIFNSKEYLEEEFHIDVNAFSYPNGNYSDREIELCKEAGYECAITVDFGFNSLKTNPFRLKRLPVDGTEDVNELLVKASGLSEILGVLSGQKPRTKYNK